MKTIALEVPDDLVGLSGAELREEVERGLEVSVSSWALFTRDQPPRPLLPDFHGMLNCLVEQFGIVA